MSTVVTLNETDAKRHILSLLDEEEARIVEETKHLPEGLEKRFAGFHKGLHVSVPALPIRGIEDMDLRMALSIFIEDQRLNYRDDEWFPMSAEKMQSMTGMNTDKQFRILGELERVGYIERKVQGSPVMRYIRINYLSYLREYVRAFENHGKKKKKKKRNKK